MHSGKKGNQMRYIVLCLVFGGCALGFHANPTDQGLRVEAGVYPTEASGDFGAKLEDAGTRRVYANACDRAREPAACLFALSVGANQNAARLAYSCGSRYCWGGGPRPFGGSAHGMVPMGASYDVAAVNAAYQMVSAAVLSTGPDIVRPRPAYLAAEPVEEPPASPRRAAVASGGGDAVRSGNSGVSAPRRNSFPRPPGASAPAAQAPQMAACATYQTDDWPHYLRLYQGLMEEKDGALARADAAEARRLFDEADRILRRGLDVCAGSAEHLRVIRQHRANLDRLRQRAGFNDQEA